MIIDKMIIAVMVLIDDNDDNDDNNDDHNSDDGSEDEDVTSDYVDRDRLVSI